MSASGGLLLSDDLIFASRVTATGRAAGLSITQVRDPAALVARLLADAPACVILDLQVLGNELNRVIETLTAITPRPRLVAFGSHVHAAALHAARQAGCDIVLPRSAFADRLETELPQWLTRPS